MVTKEDCLNPQVTMFVDNSGHRWKKSGQCQTWKRNTSRYKQPVKHGLYAHSYINETNAHEYTVIK